MPTHQIRIESEARVRMPDGRLVVTGTSRTVDAGPAAPATEEPSATVGFGSVRWRGTLYWLSPQTQRLMVAHLWEANEAGEPFVSEDVLLATADARGKSVKQVFRGSAAWDSLVVPGPTRGGPVGTYCLGFATLAG